MSHSKPSEGLTYILFPGLDALMTTSKTRRWLDDEIVSGTLSEASSHLSNLTGQEESLQNFLTENARPHLADFNRMLVALTAIQVGIGRSVFDHVAFDGLTSCSHGDFARLVTAESISLADAVEMLWIFSQVQVKCEPGYTANVRPLLGNMTPEQLEWMANAPVAVSQWSDRHATAAGTEEHINAFCESAVAMKMKVRPVLPFPIHSPVMQPAILECTKHADKWAIKEPKLPIFSSVYARPISSSDEIRQEAIDGALSPVRWLEAISGLVHDMGVKTFVSIGPNSSLTGWIADTPKFEGVEILDAWDIRNPAS